MNIVITGGAGFIGSNIAQYHLAQGDSVTIIDNFSTGSMQNIQAFTQLPNFKIVKKNIEHFRNLSDLLIGIDRIYHFAALVGMFHVIAHPILTLEVNINGTLKLFKTIAQLGSKPLVIVASSSEVYGEQHQHLSETSPLILEGSQSNHAAYAISKLGQESIAMAFTYEHQIPTIVLRIFNTVGKNQSARYGMVIPRFIKQAIHNEDITVFGDGSQKRSFCNVADSVCLIDLLAKNPASVGQIVNVGQDEEISINDLAKLIKKLSMSQSKIIHIPFEEAYKNNAMTITERKPNIAKLMDLTRYQYQFSLEKTINDIIAFKKGLV